MRKKTTWGALALLLASPAVLADWKCTMPNGRVIYKQLSSCPADAVTAEEVEAVPSDVRPAYRGEFKPPATLPPAPQAQPARPVPAPAERSIVDEAYAICTLLRTSGASTCNVEVNVFSASYIDATVPTTPKDAQAACLAIANMTRQPGSPFIGRGWQLKMFSPFSDKRPMAVCTL